ncbi:hypothetical protein OG618_16555 [Kitasatospora sp. NBC_01246]|uniref:DUF7144 family membrane protein n=1 Tax=Kitasatospora sp. NBC_01246 TaxID=2903570 RepID=UPI002E35A157|nr:hypothetical protein [Kitasatospora sp. NBC_01246]
MSTSSPTPDQPPPGRPGTGAPPPPPSADRFRDWAPGLVMFAGVLMLINGFMEAVRGIMAVADDDIFVSTPRYVFRFDLTGWGWVHIVIGALVAVVGAFVLKGAAWARWAGVFLTALSALDNFLALPYYPLWSIVVIALDVFIIWALCVYRPEDDVY